MATLRPRIDITDDAMLVPLEADFGQVRSRERVRDLAELFTYQREIDAMLDLIPDAFNDLDVKFLEPSSGTSSFLAEELPTSATRATNDCGEQQ